MQIKEIRVPTTRRIYKVVDVLEDGTHRPTGQYRVRRRHLKSGRWTTQTTTVDSFEEAKRLARQEYVAPARRANVETTFKDAFEQFMRHKEHERRLARGTIDGYWNRYRHLRFFEPLAVASITPKTIDVWINMLLDPEYVSSQQGSRICYDHEFTLLVSFFRYFRNFIDESFTVPILDRHRLRACARPKSDTNEIRFLNVEEETSFLSALGKWPAIRDLALFQLHTGARVGEAAAMEFRNVDVVRNEVRIVQHLHWERHKNGKTYVIPGTKGGPSRSVPLTPECKAMLLRRKHESPSSVIFADDVGEWLEYRSIQSIYDRAFKRLGLPHSGTHVARHTFAVRFLDQTKDIYALQKLLGHTDLKVTQVYAKYSNESVRRSFQLFRGGLASENEAHVPQVVPFGRA